MRQDLWRKILLVGVMVGGLWAGGQSTWAAERKVLDRVRIVVGKEVMTQRDVDMMLRLELRQLAMQLDGEELKRQQQLLEKTFVERLVENLMMESYAKRQGIQISQEEIQDRVDAAQARTGKDVSGFAEEDLKTFVVKDMLRRRVIEQEVSGHVHVGDEEIRQACQKDNEPQKEIHVGHILVRGHDDAALAKIKKIRQALEGGADFGLSAFNLSEDPTAKDNRGDLGFTTRGQFVPEFEDTAFALPVGGLSTPVKTQFGYHLIRKFGERMRDKADCAALSPTVKARYTDKLYRVMWEERREKFLAKLRDKTFIKVYE